MTTESGFEGETCLAENIENERIEKKLTRKLRKRKSKMGALKNWLELLFKKTTQLFWCFRCTRYPLCTLEGSILMLQFFNVLLKGSISLVFAPYFSSFNIRNLLWQMLFGKQSTNLTNLHKDIDDTLMILPNLMR